MAHVTQFVAQQTFRARNDDGSETSATWKFATNTDWSQNVDETFRVRFLIEETAGGSANNYSYVVYFSLNGGAWTACDPTTAVHATPSAFVVDVTPTTQQIGAGSFVAGEFDSDGGASNISLTAQQTEMEYCLTLNSAQINDGDTIALRVYNGNGALDAYNVMPTITAIEATHTPQLNAYRFYNDDGTEATTTPLAAQDTAASVAVAVDNVVKHLRLRIDETGGGASGLATDDWQLQVRKNAGAWADVNSTSANVRATSFQDGAAWELGNAAYDNVSKPITQDTAPRDVFFSPDGLKMYVLGSFNDRVYQYTLGTAWDVSTAVYDNISKTTFSEETGPSNIFFKSDGTKLYVVGSSEIVYQYTLGTAWDVSTAVVDATSKAVGTEVLSTVGLYISPDGLKMYVGDNLDNTIHQYTLGTAWDVSTAIYDTISKDVTTQDGSLFGLHFKSDGLKLYVTGFNNDSLYQYTLGVAWDISTATYDNVSKLVSAQDTVPYTVFFKSDGLKFYVVGGNTDTIYQYSTIADVLTSQLTDGAATTNRATGITDPGTGSFIAGEQEAVNGVIEDFQLTGFNFTEHVFGVEFIASDLADADTLEFRLLRNGVAITSGSVPTSTISSTTVVDGAGVSVASAQTTTGSGTRTIKGSSVSTATPQTSSGSGTKTAKGSGVSIATPQTTASTGSRTVKGSGVSIATPQITSGSGSTQTTGSGTSVATPQITSASGTRIVKGSGTSVATPQTTTATGSRVVKGSAASTATPQTTTASGSRTAEGSGTSVASPQTSTAVGVRTATGSGASVTTPQATSASGVRVGKGSGVSAATSQTTTSTGTRTVKGSGASVATPQTTTASQGPEAKTGEGVSVATPQTTSASGIRIVKGSGSSVATSQATTASGSRTTKGSGLSVATPQTTVAAGARTVKGTGDGAASSQLTSATGTRTVLGTGAGVVSAQLTSGSGTRIVIGFGVSVASAQVTSSFQGNRSKRRIAYPESSNNDGALLNDLQGGALLGNSQSRMLRNSEGGKLLNSPNSGKLVRG